MRNTAQRVSGLSDCGMHRVASVAIYSHRLFSVLLLIGALLPAIAVGCGRRGELGAEVEPPIGVWEVDDPEAAGRQLVAFWRKVARGSDKEILEDLVRGLRSSRVEFRPDGTGVSTSDRVPWAMGQWTRRGAEVTLRPQAVGSGTPTGSAQGSGPALRYVVVGDILISDMFGERIPLRRSSQRALAPPTPSADQR